MIMSIISSGFITTDISWSQNTKQKQKCTAPAPCPGPAPFPPTCCNLCPLHVVCPSSGLVTYSTPHFPGLQVDPVDLSWTL